MDTRNQTAHLGQYWHCYPNPRKPDNGIIHYTQRNGKLKVKGTRNGIQRWNGIVNGEEVESVTCKVKAERKRKRSR